MSRLRTLAKESLAYGVSSLLSRFLNFLLVPFYTHVLSPSEFGVSNIVFALIAFLNVIYQAGFDSAYLRLAHDAEGEDRKKLFSTAFWSQAGLSLVFTVPFLLASTWLGEAFRIPGANRDLFPLAAIILALDTLSVVPMAHLRTRHQALRFASVRLGSVIVNIGGNIIFVLWLHQGIRGIFLANILASAFTLILLLPILWENLRGLYNNEKFRELLRFGLPFMPAGLYGIINEMSGRLFLGRLNNADLQRLYPGKNWDVLHLTGLFSAAWKVGVFGLLLVQMYRMAWQPFFLQHQRDPDAPALFGRVLRVLMLFVGTCGLVLMLFLDKIVAFPVHGHAIIARPFWDGLPIVPGVLLAYAFQAWFVHFTLGVYIAKQTRSLIWINGIGAVITVILNFALVPYFGLWGAVWAAVACYAVMAFLMMRRSQSLFAIDLAWRRLLPLLFWLAFCFIAGFWVQMNSDASWTERMILLVIGLGLPFVLGGVTRREAATVLSLFRSRAAG